MRLNYNAKLQAFGGKGLTYKLHFAVRHLFDQLRCQGPGAWFLEFWIERMVHYLKHQVRYRVRENPELVFVNDHLLAMAALLERCRHPEHCLSLLECSKSGRKMVWPLYDEVTDRNAGVLLLGRRGWGARKLTCEEANFIVSKRPGLMQLNVSWFAARGWPLVSADKLERLLQTDGGRGHDGEQLYLDEFFRASLSSMDELSCIQNTANAVRDNTWVHILYRYNDGVEEKRKFLAIARALARAYLCPIFAISLIWRKWRM
jgi:hypothetical protein